MTDSFATKDEARRWVRERSPTLADDESHRIASLCAQASVDLLPREGCAIAIYSALPGEIPMEPIWRLAQARRCFVALPRISVGFSGQPMLEMYRVREGPAFAALEPGPFNTMEPPAQADFLVLPEEIRVFFVPGLLFRRDGSRLGRGGGFYDAYLARAASDSLKIGVGFGAQLTDREWPAEEHDIRVDRLLIDGELLEIAADPPEPPSASAAPVSAAGGGFEIVNDSVDESDEAAHRDTEG